jgi:hypothetical protein
MIPNDHIAPFSLHLSWCVAFASYFHLLDSFSLLKMSSTSPTGSLSGMSMSYTALIATLVLLLAVSSAIVVRSLVLRRRHQRIVEEAIRAGTWLPHQAYDPRSSRRRRDIGKKPKMWEAWLRSGHGGGDSKCAWNDIIVCTPGGARLASR